MRRKEIRSRGKLALSRYFKALKTGDFVSVIRERTLNASFPKRLQGKTGVIEGKRGGIYVVKIKDQDKEKKFLIEAIHLKKVGSK